MNFKSALFFLLFISQHWGFAQYPGAAGQPGTTAMYKDSVVFAGWANGCRVTRGYQDISSVSMGYASSGDSSMALGKAQSNGVVSLGDGGWALCTFPYPIKNGPGADFAVFENSFDDSFLELAFVEVSSDGLNFVRFKAHSLTDTTTQTGTFGATDPTKINNLAGKYRSGYGTPFDLQELAGKPGLNINAITHVKIIDVVGSINKSYATYDGFGNKINDPWPTGFASGGFDLDALGVIHQQTVTGLQYNLLQNNVRVFPNPVQCGATIKITSDEEVKAVYIINAEGLLVQQCYTDEIETALLPEGIYVLRIFFKDAEFFKKIVISAND